MECYCRRCAMRTRGCDYCNRKPATPVVVPEPTDHNTYREANRTLCVYCKDTYMRVPYGFALE